MALMLFGASVRPRSQHHPQLRHVCRAESQQPAQPEGNQNQNKLAAIIKRKQRQLGAQLTELGEEALEERLRSATESPIANPYQLATLVAEIVPTGRPVLVLEACRGGDVSSSLALADHASALAAAGADALVVRTDDADTPEGLGDLFAVCRAVRVPVLRRDWFLHPLQVCDAKEAGCAGLLGVTASVTGPRGTPVLSSFAAALGLDCPVEVVNMPELQAMERSGVAFFGLNVSVGLSVPIAGFGADVARGLLGELPFGVASLVGARSVEEAGGARAAGADAVLVKAECVAAWRGRERELLAALRDATCGDD